LTFFLKKKIS